MVRRLLLVCVAFGIGMTLARPALAQAPERSIGGGAGYTYDFHSDFFVIDAVARFPVTIPNNKWFHPFELNPRFEVWPSFGQWQLDLDGVWDIPVLPEVPVRPYMGIGIGVGHTTDATAVLFNIDAGLRYKKPDWHHEFAVETHFSAGLTWENSMSINFLVFFPMKK
jgi:hypothetical protein